MNIIICTDISRSFILQCFIETIIHSINTLKKETKALIIIGDKQKETLPKVINLIKEYTELNESEIIIYNGLNSISEQLIEKINKFSANSVKSLKKISDIEKIKYNNFDVGIPVTSNLISASLCSEPNIKYEENKIRKYILYSLFTYHAFEDFYKKNKDNTFYIYNGRSYNTYPISILLNNNKARYYERIDQGRRLRVQNDRIHNALYNSELAYNHWINSSKDNEEKKNIAISFFDENRNNIFTKNFNTNELSLAKNTIIFFTSSDDEFASLHPEIKINRLFKNQRDCIKSIIEWASNQNKYKLLIRVHPHQEKKCIQDRSFWNGLSGKNVSVIESSSNINSYSLIKASEKIVSYLSSIGIEATYYGKPSITLANSYYSNNDATYEPKSINEFIKLLESDLQPKKSDNCLFYGYFQKTYGYKFKLDKNIFEI